MRRSLLTSCASTLVIALMAGNAATAQQQTYVIPPGQSQTVNSQITDGTSTTSVESTGGGILVLTNPNNSFTGGVTVDGLSGISVSTDGQLGNSSGSIALGNSSNIGTLYLTSPVNAPFTSARTIGLNAAGGAINASGTSGTFSGVIQGSGTLYIDGGTVAITNTANTYTGGTYVSNNATLQVSTDSVLGSTTESTIQLGDAISHGTLQFTNVSTTGSTREIIIGTGGATINLTDPDPVNGLVTLSGTIIDSSNTSFSATPNGPGLTISGTGALALTGINLYQGDTHVEPGAVLQINSDYALGGYSATTNALTGVTSYTLSSIPNSLYLDGGSNSSTATTATLQFSANTNVIHPVIITGNATIDTQTYTDTVGTPAKPAGPNINAVTATGISGSGTLSKIGTGDLILDGLNSYTGGTIIAQGALTVGDAATPTASVLGDLQVGLAGSLGGSGRIYGTVSNQGIVNPANVLTATNYIQYSTGTLSPEIGPGTSAVVGNATSASNSAAFFVTGNATILGGTIEPSFAPGFLHAGKYEIFSAATLTGQFSNISGGTLAPGSSVTVPSLGLVGTIQQVGNDYYVVLTQLSSLPNYDRPDIVTVMSNAAVDGAQASTGVLLDRLAGARTSAMADELGVSLTELHRVRGSSPYGLWIQPTANNGSVTGNSGVAGYSSRGGGLLGGIDTEWAPGVSIGLSLGFDSNYVNQGSSGSGTIAMPRMSIYGGWWRGPFALDAVIGFGLGNISDSRPVAGQTAYGSHAANEKIAALQASAAYAFDGWVIGPAVGAKYLNLRETSFTEGGTTLYDFTVANGQIDSLRPYVNVDLSKRFLLGDHWALVPEIKAGFEHEQEDQLHHVTVMTAGDAQNFLYYGLLPGASIVRLNGGLRLETSRDMAFYVDYDRLQSSTSMSQYVTGGFRYRL